MSLFLSHCLPRAKPRTRCFIITLFMSPTRQLRCRHRWNTEVNRSPSYCCHSAALSVRNHPNSIGFVVAGAWTLRRLEILIQAVNKRPRPPPERRRLFWLGDGFAYLCRRRIAEMEQQLAEGSAYLKKLKVICFVFYSLRRTRCQLSRWYATRCAHKMASASLMRSFMLPREFRVSGSARISLYSNLASVASFALWCRNYWFDKVLNCNQWLVRQRPKQ